MDAAPDIDDVAVALRLSLGLVLRRLRQLHADGELTMPESSVLVRLERDGQVTPSALARLEHVTPQSMGATLKALEQRGLIERRPDPEDGRRIYMSITEGGNLLLRSRFTMRVEQFAQALSSEFTPEELMYLYIAAPLLERLGHTL
jgi:DNA-binding MarR family transcriptional regulator